MTETMITRIHHPYFKRMFVYKVCAVSTKICFHSNRGGTCSRCSNCSPHNNRRLRLRSRQLLKSTTDDGVGDAVVHVAQFGDEPHHHGEFVRRRRKEFPNEKERIRPPLEDEDEDEDHHQSCRVVVAVGICVHELSCAFYLDPDGAIAEQHANKEDDLKYTVEHAVSPAVWCSFIDETTSTSKIQIVAQKILTDRY